MKKMILMACLMAFASCNNDTAGSETKVQNVNSYSCPMHQDVEGKKGEKCSECGMDLMEPATAIPDSSSKKN